MQSLVLTDMAIIGAFLQNTFTDRQFVCKIQKREYSIYRRVYFAMKGGWIMSEKKLRNITDVLCFLMILGYVMYLVATWGNLPERVPIHFNAHGIPDRYREEGQPSSGADFGAADPGTSDVLSEISTVVELSS